MSILLWLSLALLFYVYAGYPLAMALLATWRPRPVRKAPCPLTFSVVFAVHNEAPRLRAKVESLLHARGTERLREILIGSDGSDDHPASALDGLVDARVRLTAFPARRGKPSVLNDLVSQASGDVLLMMDARQELDPGAFEALLANFADERVGVVSGELVFRTDGSTAAARGMDAYWRFEKFLRKKEALVASVPGATGALYAIRRSLFRPIPPQTLLDDVAIPMQAVMAGYRCVFEPGAVVFDRPSATTRQESVRKRRTLAGNLQLVGLFPVLLHPLRNPIWLQFVSHKLGRLIAPWLMLGALGSNLALWGAPSYRLLAWAQVSFYGLAVAGLLARRAGLRPGPLALPGMFVALNASALLAWWDVLTGRHAVTWQRTAT